MKNDDRKLMGSKGERLAAAFLVDRGYRLLGQNIRIGRREIDLLARDQTGTLVVVEVKTRRSSEVAPPQAGINWRKRRTLRGLAAAVADRYPENDVRIDVVEVDLQAGRLHHIKNI